MGLGESVPALLGQLFDRLSQPTNHGPLLVNRVLGYLSASRHGLAENEILEILFADPEYRAKLNEAAAQTRHALPPNATRIPIALWSRLRFDLAPYLTERAAPGANVLTFYHRQVAEWVEGHFAKSLDQSWQPHRRLADYFRNLADPENNQSWRGVNPRPFLHVVYHQVWADRADEYCQTLCDLHFVEARCRVAQVFELVADYQLAQEHLPEEQAALAKERSCQSPNLARCQDHLLRFARGEDLVFEPVPSKMPENPDETGAGDVATNPSKRINAFRLFVGSHAHLLCRLQSRSELVLQLAFNSDRGSPVSRAAEHLMFASPGSRLLEPDHLRRAWNPSPALICTIDTHDTHAESVTSLDFSVDGRNLFSLGNRPNLWEIKHRDSLEAHPIALPPDVEKSVQEARSSADAARVVIVERSGLLVSTPDGTCERRIVTNETGLSLVITADARWAATFSGRVFHEWNLRAGSHHRSVTTQSGDIDAIAMSADGRRIITAHGDRVVRLYDLGRGAQPVSVPLVVDPNYDDVVMRFTRYGRLLIAYPRDGKYYLDVLGRSGALELSLPLGDDGLSDLAVTADGSQVFVGQDNGTVRCFDLSTGACIRAFRTAYEDLQLVALRGRDSQLVVVSSDYPKNATEIWTLATGQHARSIRDRDNLYWTAQALLPDSNTLVVKRYDQGVEMLELRNLLDGHLVRTLGPWEQAGSEVVVPDDARRIFTGSWQHGIQEWSLGGRTPPRSLGEEENTVRKFHCDAAGVVGLSSREDTPLRLWDLRTQQCVREIPALSDWEANVRVSPDGRLAASCDHEFVLRIWDGAPGGSRIETTRLTGHKSVIHALAVTPDGKTVVSGSWDSTMRAWDLATGTSRILRGHNGDVDHVIASADGKLGVSWATDGTLRVWDLTTAREIKILETNTERIESLSMTADGALVASGDEHGRIKLWDVEHGQLDQGHRRHNWFVTTVCLLPGSTVLTTGSGDGTIGIWDLSDRARDTVASAGDVVRGAEPDKVQSIVPLANGFASAGQDGKIRLWDVKTRECCGILVPESYGELYGCNQSVLAVAADHSFLVSGNDLDTDVYIWDVARRRCIKSISLHESGMRVEAIALSADGRSLACFSSTTMELWDIQAARCLRTTSLANFILTAQFTPRGDRVVVAGDHVVLWDPFRGERVWSMPGYRAAVSPTGDDLIVASGDVMYHVDLSSGKAIREFRGHGTRLSDLEVTPDGRWVLSAGADRTIRVWSIDSGEYVAMDVLGSQPWALSRISAHGLFAYGTEAGEVFIRKMTGIEIGPCLATPVRRWIHGEQPHWDQGLAIRCPECAHVAPENEFPKTRAAACVKCGVMLQATPFAVDVFGRGTNPSRRESAGPQPQ